MSIRKNSYVLPFGRFMSGVCRWYFRFVTGEFPPTQWYGGFTLVFDPGIHDVTTLLKRFGLLRYQIRSKDINSGIDDFLMTLPVGYIQETEKNRFFLVMMHLNLQKQNLRIMDSQMPHTWVVGNDDVDHVVGSNTSQVGSLREETMNLLLCSDLWSSRVIFRDLSKSGKAISSKNTVETTTMVILFVILLKRITESSSFRKTLVRTLWYHCVYISEFFMDTSGLKLRFAKIKFSYKLLHANRNREKSNMKLDNNGSYGRLASKTTLRKASSISLLLYFS
ncbi:unnamed protein product [Arabidopsis lyrata]|uniref:Predicted protein n=1 Tax=Arabidopsis lyrata subsp. lyrata TaxID=81972 RepID=D7KB09_ARALL|nr:predicted protein [Arabidopsis lyrata subsp. lyrata]CAH8256703.1 unnamed protein product [Arabidopsis lyrata]